MNNTIREMIGDKLVDILAQACIYDVADDDYRATEVRQGLMQQDPVAPRIMLLVNGNNPDDLKENAVWGDDNEKDEHFRIAYYEIGGGSRWWAKYTVDVNCYLVRSQEDRNAAREIARTVFARAEQAIRRNQNTMYMKDDFGNTSIFMLWRSTEPVEQGGPPRTFIHEGKIFVKVLVESE